MQAATRAVCLMRRRGLSESAGSVGGPFFSRLTIDRREPVIAAQRVSRTCWYWRHIDAV